MDKKTSIILNIIFGAIFLIGIVWFLIAYSSTSKQVPQQSSNQKIEQTQEKGKSADWEGIITSVSAAVLFLSKLYYERKKSIAPQHETNDFDNKKHPIFAVINELQMNELRNLDLGAPGRTAIFKLMLQEQIKAYESECKKFTLEKFETSAEFREKARMMVLTIVETYEQAWIKLQVPEIIIERYKQLQEDRIKLLLSDVDTIAFYRLSDETKNFDEVIFYLLTHVSVILKLSVTTDMFKTLRTFNGDLKKITYNGMPL